MSEKEDGLIAGIVGAGEAEEREAEEATARADDVATAVMMDAARFDPVLSKKAGDYLDEQRSLVRLQVRHFDEERKLAIEAAKRRRFFDHFRMSFQALLTTLGFAIGLGAILMVWDAVQSRSVVIDAFETPPSLAGSGLNGKVVAAGLLDALSHIQAATRSTATRRSLSNAWTNDISIEVPETGISIGQIERTLKARFGHDQHIDGDLVVTDKGGLALTVRGTGILAKTFTDDADHLDKLLTDAGEYIYGQSEPGLYANYLTNADRDDDAIKFAQTAYPSVEAGEKPYVLNYWANAISAKGEAGSVKHALELYQEAVRLKPDYWVGYNNVMLALGAMGDEEGLIRTGEQMQRIAGGRLGRAPEDLYENFDEVKWDLTASISSSIANMESHSGVGTITSFSGSLNLNIAQHEALRHDKTSAALRIQTTQVDPKSAPDVAAASMAKALLAEEVGDLTAATAAWDAFAISYSNPAVHSENPPYMCYAAPAYEKTGQHAKADATLDAPLNATGYSTFVDCYRFKGDVLELRGDWVGAQAWYAKAIKLSPNSPSGYYSLGMALVKHDDLRGAAEQFRLANQQGPHWADPLKAWGDVLVKQGHRAEALGKYSEAMTYAPNWSQLKEAQAAAKDRS